MIQTRIESARGCGYRKPGGMYLVADNIAQSCGWLPQELTVCPCCNNGIKPSRGWTWLVKWAQLFKRDCKHLDKNGQCNEPCAVANYGFGEKAGLIWIGESFYNTPNDFIKEAWSAGISRRLSNIPHDLVVGKTLVFLAHRKTYCQINQNYQPVYTPGIFAAFIPKAIEYIVKGDESPGHLSDLEKRGFTLVKVVRDIDAQMGLEDQLAPFTVNYSVVQDGVEIRKAQTMKSISKQKARDQFKKSFPNAKVISVK